MARFISLQALQHQLESFQALRIQTLQNVSLVRFTRSTRRKHPSLGPIHFSHGPIRSLAEVTTFLGLKSGESNILLYLELRQKEVALADFLKHMFKSATNRDYQ